MNISKLSVKRPVAMAMVVMVFVVLGLYALTALPLDLTPEMSMPMALVYSSYSGTSPQEMENLVTKPIEEAISTVSGIKNIISSTSEGTSMVMAEFDYSVNMDIAAMDMREKLDMASYALPDDMTEPTIMKLDPSMMPIGTISISKEGADATQVKAFAEDEIASKLESISGIASVSVVGGKEREIQINVDPSTMAKHNIGLANIIAAVAGDNVNRPGGNIESGGKNLSVRTIGEFMSLNDLSFVPVTLPNGTMVYLRDIATIKDAEKEVEVYNRLSGGDCVTLSIQKQSGGNTVQVMEAVNKKLKEIKEKNPDAKINMIFDQSQTIKMTVWSVVENALIGAVLAILILLLFLRSVRITLVMAISIPTSIIATFAAMYFCGITLNMISLAGLMLGVGMLVDSSIVMLENIFRMRNMGVSPKEAAVEGAKQVTGAIVASVITTCVVYVPVAFVNDMAGILFKEMALTIVFSQLSALMVTLLIVPAIAAGLPVEKEDTVLKKRLQPFENGISKLTALYERILRYALTHRKRIVAGTLAAFMISVCLIPFMGFEFMGTTDSGQISVSVELPKGSTLDDTDEIVRQVEEKLSQHPEVVEMHTTVGSSGIMSITGSGSYSGSVSLTLTDKSDRKQSITEIMDDIRTALKGISGAAISVSDGGGFSMGSGGISINIAGDDHETLEEIADQLVLQISKVEGLREVESSVESGKPEIQVKLNRLKLSNYGLNTSTAANLINTALQGAVASTYRDGGTEYDIRVQIPKEYRDTKEDLKNIKLMTAMGGQITIGDIAEITDETGPVSIMRENQKATVTVSAQTVGRSISKVSGDIQKIIDEMQLPGGYSIEFGGDMESMTTSFTALGGALMLGILLVYMVMAAQFESLVNPLVVIFSIPLALIGVVLSFILVGANFGVTAFIGLIMLAGVVVNNAIVLIEFINNQKTEDYYEKSREERYEIIVNAGKTRLRPILMTTLTTILAYIPAMVSNGQSAGIMRPLAITVFGGLLASTVLTLVFIPTLYSKVEDMRIKKKFK